MICDLELENFLFIPEAHLEFHDGMNVITGETGAGKSVLLEGIKLLLGKKARPGLILQGEKLARIQARFDLSKNAGAREFLSIEGLLNEDSENELIISRTFKAEGGEKMFVNGVMTTISRLRALGVFLMEIHGQNEHQTLLDPKVQRHLVDRTGNEFFQKKLVDLGKVYQQKKALNSALECLREKLIECDARVEELQEIKTSLETLNLSSPEEEENIREELNRLSHFEQIIEAYSVCHGVFSGENENEGISQLLYKGRESLRRIFEFDAESKAFFSRIDSLYQEAIDIQKEMSAKTSDRDFDPDRLGYLQSRLSEISRLCRRYKTDFSGLFLMRGTVERELVELSSPETTIRKHEEELKKVNGVFENLVGEIGEDRKKLSQKLEKSVTSEMQHLGFTSPRFSVAISSCEFGPDGGETLEFKVSLNPGTPGGALRKIASGGELSRVALAIKTVLAKGDELPSLVFDEIDSGIGGETAGAVARSLVKLGKEKQVILVTHLHQIAKEGSRHFIVEKKVKDAKTRIEIQEVQGKTREKEIARMLGQTKEEGLQFARAILRQKEN